MGTRLRFPNFGLLRSSYGQLGRQGVTPRPLFPRHFPPGTFSFPTLPQAVGTQRSVFYFRVSPPPKRFGNKKPLLQSKHLWQWVAVGGTGITIYYLAHLEEAPITGRRRFMAVSDKEMEIIAKQSYQEIMEQYGSHILPPTHRYSVFVRRIAERIIRASGMDALNWEFYVIDSPEHNAFVLPGGKVFVFTGILPIVKDADGLATVLGHEIAHQLAGHHAEKMSYGKFLQIIQFLVSFFVDPSFMSFNRLFLELGILLPNSRKCETEADMIGLQLMAQACFDPKAAVGLWERMSEAESQVNLEYLSTHPNSRGRIQRIKEWLPDAEQKMIDSSCHEEAYFLTKMFPKRNINW
ncbi:metalloendopeptidase [Dispira parvispora]|uniref:Metalloendopeptidase n=1 Tax=Dispira parvispora TaxID=1520584 RepID=A0A9W8AMG2_9FUNG|nr:metalloendopeptidase [Dispira parvispora]